MRDFGRANFERLKGTYVRSWVQRLASSHIKHLGFKGQLRPEQAIYLDLRCHTFSITKEDTTQTSQFFRNPYGPHFAANGYFKPLRLLHIPPSARLSPLS